MGLAGRRPREDAWGTGPVTGTLRVDSAENRTATFTADTGGTITFRGKPDGFSDLNCPVAG